MTMLGKCEIIVSDLIFGNLQPALKFSSDKWAGKACLAVALAKVETAQPYHHKGASRSRQRDFTGVGRVSPLTADFCFPVNRLLQANR